MRCAETGKRRYPTHDKAHRVMKRMPNAAVLNVYPCDECHGFHIGHLRGWRRQVLSSEPAGGRP